MTSPLPMEGPGRWARTASALAHPVRTTREMLADGPLSVLLILFVLNGVDELTRTAFGVLAPDIADDFGVGLAGIFTVLALVSAVALGLQVPIANLADRHNRVRLAVLGGVIMAVFTTLVGFSPGCGSSESPWLPPASGSPSSIQHTTPCLPTISRRTCAHGCSPSTGPPTRSASSSGRWSPASSPSTSPGVLRSSSSVRSSS